MSITREAGTDDLRAVWRAVTAAHTFVSVEDLVAFRNEGAWRVRVGDRGEAMVLERWREHLDLLAIRAVRCAPRQLPLILDDARALASEHGLGRLLSPPIADEHAVAWESAGMRPHERIVVARMDVRRAVRADPPSGVTVRGGGEADREGALAADRASFDGFWAFDAPSFELSLRGSRLGVATVGGDVIGYTLATLRAAEGTLARLAVAPPHRCRGVGTALLREAAGWMRSQGARSIVLSTQEDNAASRRLYARAGMRETGGRLVVMVSAPIAPAGEVGA